VPAPAAAQVGAAEQGADGPVLLFGIGLHIEPMGVTAQGFRSGAQGDYRNAAFFARHVKNIRQLAAIVERHGGRLTIQAQSPFTQVAIRDGNPVLAELAARGHEIALHFHEDAHLGRNPESLPAERWCAAMSQEIDLVRQAAGVVSVRYWSGGNLYPGVFAAGACAGLSVNSDWKNPHSQQIPQQVRSVHPWRPAGGTDGLDLSALVAHDPGGAVVFLPEGAYDTSDYKSEDYLTVVGRALANSVAASTAGAVNVMHFTLHPGELLGSPADPFGAVERFLTEHVDPLVAAGRVQWATLAGMADAYIAWEQGGSDDAVRRPLRRHVRAGGEPDPASAGSITFAVNVHDWVHTDESAATLGRLVDLFERHGVRGDFYFTPEIARALAERHPEVVDRLRRSAMTISYHVRPPHPLYPGFDSRLRGLDAASLRAALLDYETYAVDLATGELDRTRPGGYRYVEQVFGRPPVVASAPTGDPVLRSAAQQVYRELGARATVVYHETGTDSERPFEYVNGLLVRPSDFSVTRVTAVNGSDNFWWNFTAAADAASYHPLRLLELGLAAWQASDPSRPPLITALIHENNLPRRGPEGWTSFYYEIDHGQRAEPLPPPWHLAAPDPSRLRPASEQAAIWAAYEALLAHAAVHLDIVTSEDLVRIAAAGESD
jgi:peptidoglycan/xylan/chitin deacetylase (PgdA/CDA1 family)